MANNIRTIEQILTTLKERADLKDCFRTDIDETLALWQHIQKLRSDADRFRAFAIRLLVVHEGRSKELAAQIVDSGIDSEHGL
jgi:hypothetical protein